MGSEILDLEYRWDSGYGIRYMGSGIWYPGYMISVMEFEILYDLGYKIRDFQ